MVGLRGVGKTVLLDRMRDDADAAGLQTIRIEAPERRSLPAILAPQLRQSLLRLSRVAAATAIAHRALRGLAGFAGQFRHVLAEVEGIRVIGFGLSRGVEDAEIRGGVRA